MMMGPERRAELQARTQPLLERLVEVLNELNALSEEAGQTLVLEHNEIIGAGGYVKYWPHTHKWKVGAQR